LVHHVLQCFSILHSVFVSRDLRLKEIVSQLYSGGTRTLLTRLSGLRSFLRYIGLSHRNLEAFQLRDLIGSKIEFGALAVDCDNWDLLSAVVSLGHLSNIN